MTQELSTYTRPGQAPFWLALVAVVGAGLLCSILLALAAVILVARLALKRGWLPKLAAAVLSVALAVLIYWVVSR